MTSEFKAEALREFLQTIRFARERLQSKLAANYGTGCRPKLIGREYLFNFCCDWYPELTGGWPSSAPRGRFAYFCVRVFELAGVKPGEFGKALQRAVRDDKFGYEMMNMKYLEKLERRSQDKTR